MISKIDLEALVTSEYLATLAAISLATAVYF